MYNVDKQRYLILQNLLKIQYVTSTAIYCHTCFVVNLYSCLLKTYRRILRENMLVLN